MKQSISKKLVAGFTFCVLMTAASVWFIFSSFQKLEKIYFTTQERSTEMELATNAQHIGEDLYMIIANALIDRNLTKSAHDWEAGKIEHLAELQKLTEAADTAEDHARIREAKEAFDDLIRIFEQEMLPLIRQGAPLKGPLLEMDARIDRRVETILRSLESVSSHMSDENRKAMQEFQRVLDTTTRFVMIVSIIGLFFALLIALLITRWIIHPLSDLTNAARKMENGEYQFQLKHRSADEIGLLFDTFQSMSEKVASRTIELQEVNTDLVHEISERRQSEEVVRRLNDELEQRVEARTTELVQANEHLKLMIATQHRTEEDLTRSREKLRNLSQHLQNIREEERTSIAREIHDELGQLLTALKMDLAWLKGKFPDEQQLLINKAREMDQHIEETIRTVQRISAELRPGILDDLGLGPALEWQAQEFQKRTGITCIVENGLDCSTLDRGRSTMLFRIIQEALTNISRHAGASLARVTLTETGGELVTTITDNGKGITQQQLSGSTSLGLIGMRERVRYYGGRIAIDNLPAGGTGICVNIPLKYET